MHLNQRDKTTEYEGYLTGKLLVAMPFQQDSQFEHAVIYICGHDPYGAIGLIVNKPLPDLTFKDVLRQLDIRYSPPSHEPHIHYGGPVEISRGFVLHTPDYKIDATACVDDHFAITSTMEVLRAIAQGKGPDKFVVCLGYAGWGAGQLEQELQDNVWLVVEPTEQLVFDTPLEAKWRTSLSTIGVDPAILSLESGHA